MKCLQSCLLIIVLCSLHKLCDAQFGPDLDIGFELSSKEECFHKDGVYTKLLNTPLLRCALECATRPRCLAVNHKYEETTCELVDNDDINNLRPGQCQYILKSDISVGNLPCTDCNLLQACDVVQGECVYKECPQPNIANADIKGVENSIGSIIRIRCHKGYRPIDGAMVALCLSTGEWSQSPKCIWDDTLAVDTLAVDQDESTGLENLQFNAENVTTNCTSIVETATDVWCTDNCNHFPPYCPPSFCVCNGNK